MNTPSPKRCIHVMQPLPPPPPMKKTKKIDKKNSPRGSFIISFEMENTCLNLDGNDRFLTSTKDIVKMQYDFVEAIKSEISVNGSSANDVLNSVNDYWDEGKSRWLFYFSSSSNSIDGYIPTMFIPDFDEDIETSYISYPMISDIVRNGYIEIPDKIGLKIRVYLYLEIVNGFHEISQIYNMEDIALMSSYSGLEECLENYIDQKSKLRMFDRVVPIMARACFRCEIV